MTPTRETIARALAPVAWAALGLADTLAQKNRRTASLRHADAVLRALDAAGLVVVPTDPASEARRGLEWFERTFGVPLGDMPGRLDVERVRAMIAAAPDVVE